MFHFNGNVSKAQELLLEFKKWKELDTTLLQYNNEMAQEYKKRRCANDLFNLYCLFLQNSKIIVDAMDTCVRYTMMGYHGAMLSDKNIQHEEIVLKKKEN